MIINNKKLLFKFIVLLILVTTFLNLTNYSNVKINQQQNKLKYK